MRMLIVGAGALGGVIATRMLAAGVEVWLAVRNEETAATLRRGLRTRGSPAVLPSRVEVLEAYALAAEEEAAAAGTAGAAGAATVDLTVLATKAADAIAVAPRLRGVVVPIQNGGVSRIIAAQNDATTPTGAVSSERAAPREPRQSKRIVGALSNLGATMHAPGDYEQRNAGHLLIDEAVPSGAEAASFLAKGIEVRTTRNFEGAVWSKLLLNCAVTSIGAIAGEPMRAYIERPEGRRLFAQAYAEALSVARAVGANPERMLVAPIPTEPYEDWLASVVAAYGDLEPSMLQDFRRARRTEIDFINGYVAAEARRVGLATPANDAIVAMVHAIERGDRAPSPSNLDAHLREAL